MRGGVNHKDRQGLETTCRGIRDGEIRGDSCGCGLEEIHELQAPMRIWLEVRKATVKKL